MRLVLVHGAGGSYRSWHYQLKRFPEAEAVDLPGHPRGEGRDTIAGYAAWLDEYLATAPDGEVVLGGHSMGGAIALRYALDHPGRLRALVLAGTGARLRVLPTILEGIREHKAETVEQILTRAFGPGVDPRLFAESRREMMEVPAEVIYGDYLACDRFDVMAEVGQIQLPTLILVGALDQMTPLKYARFLEERIAGSRLVVIEGAGHLAPLERPGPFNEALAAFLEGLSPHPRQEREESG